MLAESKFHGGVVLSQLQQALEKALKGFLLSRGWRLEKTHNVGYLLATAERHDASLSKYRDVCGLVTEAYVAARYPGTDHDEPPTGVVEAAMRSGRELVTLLRRATG